MPMIAKVMQVKTRTVSPQQMALALALLAAKADGGSR